MMSSSTSGNLGLGARWDCIGVAARGGGSQEGVGGVETTSAICPPLPLHHLFGGVGDQEGGGKGGLECGPELLLLLEAVPGSKGNNGGLL